MIVGALGDDGFALAPDAPARLDGLRLHFVHARDDEIVPFARAQKYSALFPAAQLHALDAGGHELGGEAGRAVASALLAIELGERARWLDGDAIAVGYRLMKPLSPAAQVARAVAVLERCCAVQPQVPQLQQVLEIGREPARWSEGHKAFRAVRQLTLLEERTPTTKPYEALLFVGEIAAKIIYNASGCSAPFDEDSPWWLPRCALDFCKAVDDQAFTDALWTTIFS